jgi:NAD+ kinase
MRVALVGQEVGEVEQLLGHFGISRDDAHPDTVISVGGDGTLLQAERKYPGLPKLPIRSSETSRKTHDHKVEHLLEKLAAGGLVEIRQMKISAVCGERKLYGLNEVIVHNELVTSAIRYRVAINGSDHSGDIIGDGLLVATPFGSTAYYRSITHSIFQVGIGLAFNNSTEPLDHLVLAEDSIICVTVLRGPAVVAADNDPHWIHIAPGKSVTVQKATESAIILALPAPA